MKVNLISLMRAGADALEKTGDECGRAYALHEAANNMILLLNGTDTIEDFQACYVAQGSTAIDLDERFPETDDDQPEIMGHCEHCSKAIREGDLSQCGGEDMIWLCEEHASTLADTVQWYQDMRDSGEWADLDHWDDEIEFLNDLDRMETDLLTNGDRKMVTPA